MAWKYKFSKDAQKQLRKLDSKIQSRIKKVIYEKLVLNPQLNLLPLAGDMKGLYKFRVGDYRLLCVKQDEELCILVVKVKHRKEVYRK
ncbi:MAG: type II toxin-antitoxin system RelE/ParE family toxin [Rhizobiaceae bacterium]|nr:type II toxin-antitoxin system RelE/ParE family toxin [Rhizobiaceae bacterium]